MNKFLKIISCLVVIVIIFANLNSSNVFAENPTGVGSNSPPVTGVGSNPPPQGVTTLSNPLGDNVTISSIILKFMEIVTYLAVLFAVLMLIWTGFQYVWARGNSVRMKELTKQLGMIVVGIAIVLGARILITAIINTIQATGTVNPQVINKANNAVRGL